MRRRTFLTLISGAAIADIAREIGHAAAQSRPRVPVIGLLSPFIDRESTFLADFREGMRAYGYAEGRNVRIEYRSAEGRIESLPRLVAELIDSKVDVIVTSSAPAIQIARQATSTVPIVMARVGDAVAQGLVGNLAHPGGNVTGASWFAPELSAKNLELLKELIPAIKRVAVLREAAAGAAATAAVQSAAGRFGIRVDIFQVRGREEFDDAFSAIQSAGAEALQVLEGLMIFNNAKVIGQLAASIRIPAIFFDPAFVDAGGLMCYGPNFTEMHRRAAYFVDRILRGANPGDLAVEQPTQFELVLNLKAAQNLGLAIPQSFVLRASRLVE